MSLTQPFGVEISLKLVFRRTQDTGLESLNPLKLMRCHQNNSTLYPKYIVITMKTVVEMAIFMGFRLDVSGLRGSLGGALRRDLISTSI